MVRECVRLKCITICSLKDCSPHVKDALIDVDIRCVCDHGNRPSDILLGFNPATSKSAIVGHSEDTLGKQGNRANTEEIPTPDEDTIQVHLNRRSEQGKSANEKLGQSQDILRQ